MFKILKNNIKLTLATSLALALLGVVAQMLGETTVFTSAIASIATNHNFREVMPGRFYRSGEMNAKALNEIIQHNAIRTIIDLRLDPTEKEDGYISEKWTAEINGASYYHVKLSSAKVPTYESVKQLLDIYDQAKTPILVHCSSGTHRTGFAAFVWMIDKEGAGLNESLDQLSLKYGFVLLERKMKAWFQSAPTLDSVVWAYRDATLASHSSEDVNKPQPDMPFRDWVKTYLSDHKQQGS